MKYLLSSLFILIFFLIFIQGLAGSEKQIQLLIPADKKMFVGEELKYIVKYSFLDLGEIRLKLRGEKIIGGKKYYNAIAYIDSYSGIPFVNLHQVYESNINSNYYSEFFRGLVKEEKYTSYTDYSFDYRNQKIHIKKGKISPPEVWTDSSAIADTQYQDGLSLFYYARMNTGQKKSENIPCFVTEEKVYTTINFYDKPLKASIDALDYDINCVRLDGSTDFVSIFGLTGYFEGWFTNDEAAVPVIAKMKVIIGNITLELVEWKRDGWNPPKYKN
jgi:hypothetical protein